MKLSIEEIKHYEEYKSKLFAKLNEQATEDMFFMASNGEHYRNSWFRDNAIIILAYLKNNPELFTKSIHSHLDLFAKFERKYNKFSSMIKYPSPENWRRLHAKFDPVSKDEIPGLGQRWNHCQNDYESMLLLNIAYGVKEGLPIIRNQEDIGTIQLLIDYVCTILEYPNCSAWEEENAMRASTSGMTYKALKEIEKLNLGFIIPQGKTERAQEIFSNIFPYEHKDKKYDLVLLFLGFYNITDSLETKFIIKDYEAQLLGNRDYGIRYKGDNYYKSDLGEMQWIFSRAYLSFLYKKLNYDIVAKIHLDKIINDFPDGNVPEGIISIDGKIVPNDNEFLSWTAAMTIIAIDMLLDNQYSLNNVLV